MNVNHLDVFVTIATNNIPGLVEFYSQLFQQPPEIHRPEVYAEFQLAQLRLGIFQPKAEYTTEFANLGSSMSLCLEVKNLEQAIATLTDLGCPPPGKIIVASHGKEIYGYDPAGTRLILHQSK